MPVLIWSYSPGLHWRKNISVTVYRKSVVTVDCVIVVVLLRLRVNKHLLNSVQFISIKFKRIIICVAGIAQSGYATDEWGMDGTAFESWQDKERTVH